MLLAIDQILEHDENLSCVKQLKTIYYQVSEYVKRFWIIFLVQKIMVLFISLMDLLCIGFP